MSARSDRVRRVVLTSTGGLLALLALAACAAGPNPAAGAGDLPGFWLGLWHGIIAPITVIVSFFTDDVSIYEVANNGNWYDFGFIVGLTMSLGGGSGAGGAASRRNGKR